MQKGKQALLLHLGVCLRLCSTILLPCRRLLRLTTLPSRSVYPRPVFSLSNSPLTLFIYPSYISSLFRFPALREEHPSPAPPLHLFFSLLSSKPHPHIPQLIFPTFYLSPRHAPALMWELRYYACGAVAFAWGSVLRPRGVLLLLPLRTGGDWAVCWTGRMNSWRVGGQWGPAEATEVTAIQNLGSQLKGAG